MGKRRLNHEFAYTFVVTAFVLVMICSSQLYAETQKNSQAKATSTTSPTTQTAKSAKGKSGKTSSKKKHRKPAVQGQRSIEASRVIEIQTALAAAGYYKAAPTGQWDEPTTKAMSSYQQDNGFKTTGKPDALSLKKLGL
jgi:peptidoglycan hydrolase-like protein with peptidoglycan-binding domain